MPAKARNLNGLAGLELTDAVFHNLVANHRLPGLAVSLMAHGESVLHKAYGMADMAGQVPMDPDHSLLRIASISKCITALALGRMMEAGLIDLDADFREYVPEYPQREYGFSLRQLAGHTAGIRGYRGKEYALDRNLSIEQSIEIFKNDPLVYPPGEGYLYNSFDFVLLSLAMERASGTPFAAYVRKNVLDPLGLRATFSPKEAGELGGTPELQGPKTAKFYARSNHGFRLARPVDNTYKLAGGGYLSTAADMARLGQAVLEGLLLEESTYETLLTSQIVQGMPTYFGLGFQVSRDGKGREFVGHMGNSVGAYTRLYMYPDHQKVVSLLINCSDPKVQEELDRALDSFLG